MSQMFQTAYLQVGCIDRSQPWAHTMRAGRFAWLVAAGLSLLVSCTPGGDQVEPGPTLDPRCQIKSTSEKFPGYPYQTSTFASAVLPVVQKSCGAVGCHGASGTMPGMGGFTIWAATDPAECDFAQSFNAVAAIIDTRIPANSRLTAKVTGTQAPPHFTFQESDPALKALRDYIAAAAAQIQQDDPNVPNPGGSGTCAPIDKFNLGTFRDEIEPILKGEIDLNNGNQPGDARGACTNGVCHGAVRGPGTLHLTGTDAAADLASFACFVDLASPSRSQVLACPTNTAGCPKQPHPGQAVFRNGTDLNYQKLLGFLFGANAGVSPFDFAFYVRNLEPLFNDVNSVEAGARGITCAETTACHGSATGQPPPNGSNFPIIPDVSPNRADLDRLTRNFVSATQFTNFLDSTESSLFLYPSDEVANSGAHKFATGLHHPGGLDFAPDSAQAKLILEWATGLRTDADGFQHNWLVAGNFNTDDIEAERLEDTVAPSIFTPHAGTFSVALDGWDGLFSPSANVDLATVLPGGGVDHVAYAVSYVLNTQATDLEALLSVDSPNALQVYVDGRRAGQKVAGGGPALVDLTLKPAGTTAASSRITIKILQRAAEPAITFKALFTDRHGTPLTRDTGELVFTLGLKGGL